MSLGDFHATISGFNGLVNINGPLAALGRRSVYAFRMPTIQQSFKAFTSAGKIALSKIFQPIFPSSSTASDTTIPIEEKTKLS